MFLKAKQFYITTTLPYVNADPHIGFALELIQADVIARYKALQGFEVFFNMGSDEHGIKILRKAQENNMEPKAYCDVFAAKFNNLKTALNVSYNNFIRTTDEHHIKAAQEFWLRCQNNGDIYKKNYKVKYCVGCELEKTDSELIDGKCSIHPNISIEIIEEENYFFKYSAYQQKLLDFYQQHSDFVIPDTKYNEIKEFTKRGLEDFSISRLKEKMPWGVDVPGDQKHVMYVWFDALVSYISALGWPENQKKFGVFWPGIQVAGKDNLRQQSSMWQAMLMSARLANSKQIFIHGFITANGQKMSKTLGNVIDPFEMVEKFGLEPFRYFLLSQIPTNDDGDFTQERFKEVYTSELSNGLGNLVARIAKLAENNNVSVDPYDNSFVPEVEDDLKNFRFNIAIQRIRGIIATLDKSVNENKPWELKGDDAVNVITVLSKGVQQVAFNLQPFLPETARKILNQFSGEIKSSSPLFPRLG
jgi:methionyl-tRNA synthetase